MKYTITSILLILQVFVFSQTQTKNMNKLLQRKAELERSISYYQKELTDVKLEILQLKQASSQNHVTIVSESGNKILATVNSNTSLKASANVNAAEIMAIPANATIYVHHEHQGMYFKTTYYGKVGWVNYTKINSQPEIDAMIETPKTSGSTTKIITVDKSDPKYIRLKKIYGEQKAIRMINKDLWAGMSHGQVRESLGKSLSQTRENTAKGLKEEWTYSDRKVIFLNGSLLSW